MRGWRQFLKWMGIEDDSIPLKIPRSETVDNHTKLKYDKSNAYRSRTRLTETDGANQGR